MDTVPGITTGTYRTVVCSPRTLGRARTRGSARDRNFIFSGLKTLETVTKIGIENTEKKTKRKKRKKRKEKKKEREKKRS